MVAGAGEQAPEVDQEPRVGTGMAVDDLIVVAHPEDVQSREGEQAQQEDVGGGQVLQLVHQQMTMGHLRPAPQLRIAEEQLDRPVDLLVEVHRSSGEQLGPVGIEQLDQTGDIVAAGLHVLRVHQAQPDLRQSLEVRTHGIGVGPMPADRGQALHQPADLAFVDQAWRPAPPPGPPVEPAAGEG